MQKLRRFLSGRLFAFFVVFTASALRFLYYGFNYYPQLDDYIQYHNYASGDDIPGLIQKLGLLSSRPLAGVSDIYVWSTFWGVLIAAALLLCAMWAASALLFREVFARRFGCGMFFCAAYSLLPLGFEGTYWLSASTRIVCGMFFTSLALYIFDVIVRNDDIKRIPALAAVWIICQFISYCYYEQILVLSLFLTLLTMFLSRRARRSLLGLCSFFNAGVYFAVTASFSSSGAGTLSSRISLALPVGNYYYQTFLPDISGQIYDAFVKGGILTLAKGFKRGVLIMTGDGSWLYFAAAVIVCALFYFITAAGRQKKPAGASVPTPGINEPLPAWKGMICAVLIAAAPVSIFFFIANPWFSLRSTVPSFAGLALLADLILGLIIRGHIKAEAAVSAVLAGVCMVASVSELTDYRAVYEHDQTVINAITETLGDIDGSIGILNLNATYLEDQNYYFHEHIHGVTESGWALTGAVTAAGGTQADKIVPLAVDTPVYYSAWNRDAKRPDSYDSIWWWDDGTRTLTFLTVSGDAESGWTLCSSDGVKYAYIYEESGYGYVDISSER